MLAWRNRDVVILRPFDGDLVLTKAVYNSLKGWWLYGGKGTLFRLGKAVGKSVNVADALRCRLYSS